MSTGIKLTESLKRTIDLEQRAIAEGADIENRNCTVNLIPYSVLRLKPSIVITPSAFKAGSLLSIIPNNTSWDMTVTRASTKTRINALGNIESVANNVPALTYINGCPSVSVEAQDTNINTWSEDFTSVGYNVSNGVINANDAIAPDGLLTADLFNQNSGTNMVVQKSITVPNNSDTKYVSMYVKKELTDEFCILQFRFQNGGTFIGTSIQVNKRTGAFFTNLTGAGGGFTTADDAGVIDFNDDYWLVYIAKANNSTGNTTLSVVVFPNRGVALNSFTQSDGSAHIWGLNVTNTLGSYIPTTTAMATRLQDTINRTGQAALIGQDRGVLFADINITRIFPDSPAIGRSLVSVGDGTGNNEVSIVITFSGAMARVNRFELAIRQNNSSAVPFIVSDFKLVAGLEGRYKVLAQYDRVNGLHQLYVNGVLMGTQNTTFGAFTSPLSIAHFGCFRINQFPLRDHINAAWILPNATLSQAQCEQLTTL
jgi:hypothetical protein